METGSPSTGPFKLYRELELQEFHDKFVIKSVESPIQGFSINRHDGEIEPVSDHGGKFNMLLFFLISQQNGV